MEQNNSLNSNIQELINVQKEQMRILNEMNNRDSVKSTQSLMDQTQETTRVNSANDNNNGGPVQSGSNPNMYMYASEQMANGKTNLNPQQTAQKVFGPPPLMYDEKTGQMRRQQFGEYASNMAGGASNYGFVSSVLPRNSRVSNETRNLTAMDFGYRASQAAMAGVGAAATAGSTWALGSVAGGGVGGFLGSMAISTGVGAAAGLYTDAAIDEIKQQSAYRKYLTQNSYMFINPQESTNDRDVAGFSQSQTKDAAKFLRGLSHQTHLKDDEVMMLTQKFTEGGMLKDTKDLESFKKQMTSLTKSVKTGALILNETYENITEVLSEFKKMGLDQKDFNETLSGIKLNASNLGIDSSQLTKDIQDYLLSLNFGTGNSNSKSYSRLEDTILYTTEMYNDLDEIPSHKRTQQQEASWNMIKNLGGTDKAAQYLHTMQEKMLDQTKMRTEVAGYFFDYDTEKKDWKFNQGKFNEFLSSDKTFGEIALLTSSKLGQLSEQGHGAAVNEFKDNAGTYMRNSMTEGDVAKSIQGTINSLLRDPQYGGNGYDTTKILADIFEIKDVGAQSLLGNYLDYRVGEGDDLGRTFKQQKKWIQTVNETKAETPSIGEWFSSKADQFKGWITQIPVSISDTFSDMSTDISDWWYRTRNGVDKPNLSDKFEIKSLKYGSSTAGIIKDQNDSLENIGRVAESLERLTAKGFSIDKDIADLVSNAKNSFKNTTVSERVRISDWGSVDEKVAERRNDIESASSKTGMSEALLSAMIKYDEVKGTNNVAGQKLEEAAISLANAVDKYKGNQTLGLLSSYGGVNVDKVLQDQLKIDINNLSNEDIEKLKNIKIDDIEISKESKELIQKLLNVDISKKEPGEEGAPAGGHVNVNYDATGTTKKNKELIKLASEKYGFSEATFAALLATENESGTNHSVNGAGARGAAQLTTSVSGWGGKVQDLVTGQTWNGSMSTVTGEENNSMNISVGAAHFNDYLQKGKQNVWVGYGMYNGGPTGFGNRLKAGGFTEDMWQDLTGNQILEMLQRTVPGTEYEKALRRFIKQQEKVTGDKNIGNKSGHDIYNGTNTADGTTGTDEKGEYVYNHGVKTYKNVDITDNTLTPEEKLQREKHNKSLNSSKVTESRNKFLDKVEEINKPSDDKEYKDRLNKIHNTDLNTRIVTHHVKEQVGKGYSYEEIKTSDEYKKLVEKSRKSGGKNIDELLKEIDNIMEEWTKFGGSGYSEDKEYESEEVKEKTKKRYEDSKKYKKNKVLRDFAESLGIDPEDYEGDMNKYNAAVNETSRAFVEDGMKQMKDYINKKNGGAETPASKAFQELSATDKAALLATLGTVNNALGKDITGYGTIEDELSNLIPGLSKEEIEEKKKKTIESSEKRIEEIDKELSGLRTGMDRGLGKEKEIGELTKERQRLTNLIKDKGAGLEKQIKSEAVGDAILSDEDKEAMQYLHRDKMGKLYYDGSKKNEETMTINDLLDWKKDGSEKMKYGKGKAALEGKYGTALGSLSFNDAMIKAQSMYDTVMLEQAELSRGASEAVGGIKNSYIKDRVSSYNQAQDLGGLNKFLEDLKAGTVVDGDGNAVSIDEADEAALLRVADAIKKLGDAADTKDIMDLINGLQDLKESIADIATATRMTTTHLDEGAKQLANAGIAKDARELFGNLNVHATENGNKNNDFAKMLKAMEGMTPEAIKEAILQGLESGEGIKLAGKSFSLDADTLMELGKIVSVNMDEAIKQSMKNDTDKTDGKGIEALVSGNEKELVAALGLKDVDELKSVLDGLVGVNEEIIRRTGEQTEEFNTLVKGRDTTIETIFQVYTDSMKDYEKSGKTATDTFKTALEKYDESIADAISVLENRVNKKGWLEKGIGFIEGVLNRNDNDNTSAPSGGTSRP